MDALSVNLCSNCSSFPCFVAWVSLFVIRYWSFCSFPSAYRLTAVMMVRRRHRLVRTGASTDTLYHCVNIDVALTSENWRVCSVVQFLNSTSILPETGYSHCKVIECQRKLHPQPRCAKTAPVTITCTTRGTKKHVGAMVQWCSTSALMVALPARTRVRLPLRTSGAFSPITGFSTHHQSNQEQDKVIAKQ